MHPHHRRRKLKRVADDLRLVARGLPAAEEAWELLTPGLKAQSFAPSTTGRIELDEDGIGRPMHADPTGAMGSTPSAARRAEADLDRALERLEREAVRAAHIVRRVAAARGVR